MQSQVILLRSALGIENIIQTPCTVIEKKNNPRAALYASR